MVAPSSLTAGELRAQCWDLPASLPVIRLDATTEQARHLCLNCLSILAMQEPVTSSRRCAGTVLLPVCPSTASRRRRLVGLQTPGTKVDKGCTTTAEHSPVIPNRARRWHTNLAAAGLPREPQFSTPSTSPTPGAGTWTTGSSRLRLLPVGRLATMFIADGDEG